MNLLEKIEKNLPPLAAQEITKRTGYTRVTTYKTFYVNQKPNRFILRTALQLIKEKALNDLEIVKEAEKEFGLQIEVSASI